MESPYKSKKSLVFHYLFEAAELLRYLLPLRCHHVLRTFTEGVLRAYSNAEGFLPVHAEVAFHCTAPLVDGYCAYGACVPAESATNTLLLEDDYGPIDFSYGILRAYVKA